MIPVFVIAAVWASAAALSAVAQEAPRPCGEPVPGRMMDGEEQAMLDRLNAYRVSRQLMPLTPSTILLASAQAKASDGAQISAFVHDDPNRTWEDRFADCGYPVNAAFGEVLGCEFDGIDALMRSWHESPVHEAVLSNSLFIAAGVARAYHPDGYLCWVIDLGSVVP
jgi:uncharacterized protein YkwD